MRNHGTMKKNIKIWLLQKEIERILKNLKKLEEKANMIKVLVKNGKLDPALKAWKRKVRNTKQLQQLRDRQEFTKPSTTKRLKKQKASYKQRMRQLERDGR
jgi:small subunit ribosomal protein S21